MKIVMVGAGNVATHLGKALAEVGHSVVQVWSRTMESASQLADALGCRATDDISEVELNADLYVISVKDDALQHVVQKLCPPRRTSLFAHTAGSVPMSCFEGYADNFGVMYPMQTFSKHKVLNFSEVPVFVEASDDVALRALQSVVESVSEHVYRLDGEGRKWLHLSAVFACNFANYCYSVASRLLEDNGIPFSVMLPLIDETARKVHELAPANAQTGPASRHDKAVMAKQLAMLSGDKNLSEIYRLMSAGIEQNAVDKKEHEI